MQQSVTYASGVGVTTPVQPSKFQELVNRAYANLVHQLKIELGTSNNPHPMHGYSHLDRYTGIGRSGLVISLSNQYKLAIANALKQSTVQLQHITNPGRNSDGQPLSSFAIVENASWGSCDNYEDFNSKHQDADPQINTAYANALGHFSASIDAAMQAVVDAAISKIQDHEGTDEYKKKLQRQRLVMPIATAAVYTLPVTGLIAGSVIVHEAGLLEAKAQALVATLPQDAIEAVAKQYYPGCDLSPLGVVVYTREYDFLLNPALNEAHRLVVEQSRALYDAHVGPTVGGVLLIVFSTIAIFTIWMMMFGDQTQNWVKEQREKLIDTALTEGRFASQFTMEQVISPASSTIIADNKVDQARLASEMAKPQVYINAKACLLLAALAHEQKLQNSVTA